MSGKLLDGMSLKRESRKGSYSFAETVSTRHIERPVLITGGAGFIGTNLADKLLSEGETVLLFDNFSRPGVEQNAEWLKSKHGDRVQIEEGDVRDRKTLAAAIRQSSSIFHFAAQVAVTTSLTDPFLDFEVNAQGTLNILETLRSMSQPPPLVFTSTNKVYGNLCDMPLRKNGSRYIPKFMRHYGVSEDQMLDFHSPYGCSKGAADQYVIDYARTFGINAAVFRMSCIYGPHQFGTEDQGWVAHFLIQALENQPITIFGDGMQVRDVLYVEDLVEAFLLARKDIKKISGHAFNIGGGQANTVSLNELLEIIRDIHGSKPAVTHQDWRQGDQRYYVSAFEKFRDATWWSPKTDVETGIQLLYKWLLEFREARSAINRGMASA